ASAAWVAARWWVGWIRWLFWRLWWIRWRLIRRWWRLWRIRWRLERRRRREQRFLRCLHGGANHEGRFGRGRGPRDSRARRRRLARGRLQKPRAVAHGGRAVVGAGGERAAAPERPHPEPGRNGEGHRAAGTSCFRRHRRRARAHGWREDSGGDDRRRAPDGHGARTVVRRGRELPAAALERELPALAGRDRGHREPDLGGARRLR